jgi:signal transduction histidine kinase
LNNPIRRLSIPTKTFLIFVFVFLIIILPVNYIAYQRVSQLVIEADIRALQSEASRLLDQVKLDPVTIPLTTTLPIRVQAGEGQFTEEIFASSDFPPLDPAFYSIPLLQFDTLVIVTVEKASTDGIISLSVARSNEDVQERLATVKWYLFAASIASIAIAAGLVFLVTMFTMRPIRKIIQQSSMIKASGQMERVSVPLSRDETYELATALNTMLNRLELSVRTQVNFFASAAHELRTPLTIMQTELSVAMNATADVSTRKTLESTLSEVERLGRIVNDFLLISQLKNESLDIRRERADLREVFYGAARKVKYLLNTRGQLLEVKTEETSVEALLDVDKVGTVVLNLLENAIKYSSIGSTIQVAIFSKDDSASLEITNTVDKPVVNLDQLKSEFSQADERSAGLGMGLWICEKVLLLHGSKLELNQADHQFSAEFSLPVD